MRGHRVLTGYTLFIYFLLLLPLLVVIVVSFNEGRFVKFPPSDWSFDWYRRALANDDFLDSFLYSLQVAVITTALSTVLGLLGSMGIVRSTNRTTRVARALSITPLTFPQVIIGLALLEYFIATMGVEITMWTLILGHTVITIPFTVQIITSSLYGLSRSYEEAARTLGASPLRTLVKVTLPIIRPGITTAAVFAFIISFDNVGISLFLSAPGSVTLPIRMFQYVETQYDPTIAVISTFLILYAMLMLLLLQRLGTLDQVFRGRD